MICELEVKPELHNEFQGNQGLHCETLTQKLKGREEGRERENRFEG